MELLHELVRAFIGILFLSTTVCTTGLIIKYCGELADFGNCLNYSRSKRSKKVTTLMLTVYLIISSYISIYLLKEFINVSS